MSNRFRPGTRHRLHVLLWKRSDRRNCIAPARNALSAEVGLAPMNVSYLMNDLARDGRIECIRSGKGITGKAMKLYRVNDPALFDPSL